MTDFVVRTDNLSRDFADQTAVDSVSVQLPSGSIVGLVGPNGAGKTTLLHLLAGLLDPTRGTAEFLGHSCRLLPDSVVDQRICVGDRSEPPGWYRLRGLLQLQGDASRDFDRLQAETLLAELQLPLTARWAALSKGQRRWVMATLAIAARPRLLLMDEPADGLDPAARLSLYGHLRTLVTEHGATVVVSSHVLGDLQRLVDDLIVMQQGRVILSDSLDELREQIREVELPLSLNAPQLSEDIQILARSVSGDREHVWVRSQSAGALAEIHQHPECNCRTVNLETLYLALTTDNRATEVSASDAKEVTSC